MDKQLERIRKAYDVTVEQYNKGIDPFAEIPEEIKNLPGFESIIADKGKLNSSAPDIKAYLDPKQGMRFLDAGCGANLANYRLDKWHSLYYGVDISPALIQAMEDFVICKGISIGGLWNTDIANLPFGDNFFDIAAVIGVLEYCTLDYTTRALTELHRVLKPRAKMVLDIPNLDHPYVSTMFTLEEYFKRPNIPKLRTVFESILTPLFSIEQTDDTHVMLKYFVYANK
jgi:ubiquinone/menaquinone biosynthesis C-methylase UbiE